MRNQHIKDVDGLFADLTTALENAKRQWHGRGDGEPLRMFVGQVRLYAEMLENLLSQPEARAAAAISASFDK